MTVVRMEIAENAVRIGERCMSALRRAKTSGSLVAPEIVDWKLTQTPRYSVYVVALAIGSNAGDFTPFSARTIRTVKIEDKLSTLPRIARRANVTPVKGNHGRA